MNEVYLKDDLGKLITGVNKLYKAVSVTLGAKGTNVIIERDYTYPLVTNDGYTIANAITLKDKLENMGLQLARETANKTNLEAGDGTTSSIVLANAIIDWGYDELKKGRHYYSIKDDLNKFESYVTNYIKENSVTVKNYKDVENIAKISSASDEIGKIIGEAYKELGFDASITIEDSDNDNTYLEIKKGMEWEQGFVNPYFCNDKSKIETRYDDCLVLVTSKAIMFPSDIEDVIRHANKVSKPLLIVAKDYSDAVIRLLLTNKENGALSVVPVKCPGFGANLEEKTQDLACLVNGIFTQSEYSQPLMHDYLGYAKSVKVTRDKTFVVGRDNEKLSERISQLNDKLNESKVDIDKENIKKRLGSLTSGVGVIKVGATTEAEREEKKLRLEDALNASKSAIEEGIVIGGGKCLANCFNKMFDDNTYDISKDTLPFVLLEPFNVILTNSGVDYIDVLIKGKIEQCSNVFDVNSGKIINGYEKGIIDPAKVTKNVVKNAVSIATLLLSASVAIVNVKE